MTIQNRVKMAKQFICARPASAPLLLPPSLYPSLNAETYKIRLSYVMTIQDRVKVVKFHYSYHNIEIFIGARPASAPLLLPPSLYPSLNVET
jgi:hypothetical protein